MTGDPVILAGARTPIGREFHTQTGCGIPDEPLNPNGGAVALGHPFCVAVILERVP